MKIRRRARRALQRARDLWGLLWREHATPREIGQAVALGVFCGCTPAVGFHAWIAIGLATLLRLNRLWALLGSRICIFFLLPWIALAEIEAGHRLRTGRWAAVSVETVLSEGRGLLLDWIVGAVLVGGALALLLGAFAYRIARCYRAAQASASVDLGPSADRRRKAPTPR